MSRKQSKFTHRTKLSQKYARSEKVDEIKMKSLEITFFLGGCGWQDMGGYERLIA